MDIILLDKNTLRIKGKNASFVVNPDSSIKTETDAVVLLGFSDSVFPKITGSRITIKGPGEYEVNGIKISASAVGKSLVASTEIDGIKLLIGSGDSIGRREDNIPECDIAIVSADSDFNQAILTSLEPKVLLVYGENKEKVAKIDTYYGGLDWFDKE